MRNTVVSHSKGQQKQGERRVKISVSTETISEKTEMREKREVFEAFYVFLDGIKKKILFFIEIQYTPN